MKTRFLLLLIFSFFLVNHSYCQEISKKEQKVVDKFLRAAADNNMKKVFKCLDKKYRVEQLEFLNGNKQQLIDELLGGGSEEGTFINVKLSEIKSIEVLQVIPLKGGEGSTYMFTVGVGDTTITATLWMIKSGKKYGFKGAVG